QNGQTVTVELSLTGILAAAHLRGAWGTLDLLQGGAVSTDEYGTSILQYIDQFGGFHAPGVETLIAGWENGKTGDEGLGGPTVPPGDGGPGDQDDGGTGDQGDGNPPGDGSLGTAGVTANTATVAIDWAWGASPVIQGFDPQSDTIFVAWIGADDLEVADTPQGLAFSIPSNNPSMTLPGVSLVDLSAANFTFLDQSAAEEVLRQVGGTDDDSTDDGGDDGSGDDGGADDHDHDHDHQMVMISLQTPTQVITGFDPSTDMIHIEAGVTADNLNVVENGSGDSLRVHLVVRDDDGALLSRTTLQNIGLDDLSLANFSIAEQSALNEVASVLGEAIAEPGGSGFEVDYDSDGSAPPVVTGTTEAGGVSYRADPNADDIVGFDPATDAIDFGNASVHGLIVTKTPAGEVVLDSPWSEAAQIVQGVSFEDLTIDSFGIVGNEHLRQDLGAVLSWEQGIGPREPDTVYIRSHEYGASQVIDDFNPQADKISFLYFGTRERLSVEDTPEGLVISSLPTGQSFTFTGVSLDDLAPGQVEFHFDQVMEDNLEVPFGFDQNEVTLVARTALLTPAAPAGETTDGHQVRDGVFSTGDGDPPDDSDPDDGNGTPTDDEPGVVALTWNWGAQETIVGFDPASDQIDFGNLGPDNFDIEESAYSAIVIEIVGNGGQTYLFEGVGAEDILPSTLDAAEWNGAALNAAQDDLAALA
ncbi:MAG: 1,4-beta-glucanase, partial [Planctomycetota bacterium]